jgi:hypothetical protein
LCGNSSGLFACSAFYKGSYRFNPKPMGKRISIEQKEKQSFDELIYFIKRDSSEKTSLAWRYESK